MGGRRPPKYLKLAHRASQNAIAGPKDQPKIIGLMVQPQLTGYDADTYTAADAVVVIFTVDVDAIVVIVVVADIVDVADIVVVTDVVIEVAMDTISMVVAVGVAAVTDTCVAAHVRA